jgi:hypothetical protein
MDNWWEFAEGSGYQGDELATYRITCPFCLQEGNFTKAHHTERKNPRVRFSTMTFSPA